MSISKRANPYQEEDTHDSHSLTEENKASNTTNSKRSPLKEEQRMTDEKLNQVKLTCVAIDENSSDALVKLMNNRHKQNEILDRMDKIYSCDVCLQQMKVYDAFNDDPSKCNDQDNVLLIDEMVWIQFFLMIIQELDITSLKNEILGYFNFNLIL